MFASSQQGDVVLYLLIFGVIGVGLIGLLLYSGIYYLIYGKMPEFPHKEM